MTPETFSRKAAPALAVLVSSLGLLSSSAQACAPDFPNRYFDAPSTQILSAPEAMFYREVSLIAGCETPSPRDSGSQESQTALYDIEDLLNALQAQGLPEADISETIARYAKLRRNLGSLNAEELQAQMPEAVPAEFSLYLLGAMEYKYGNMLAAQAAWEAVLALPVYERINRSTWAAYMLGRTATDPDAATKWFHRVRELAQVGVNDSQNLAQASWGWEAKRYLDQEDLVTAAELYLRQYQAGAPSAFNSLRTVMKRAFSRSMYPLPEDNPAYAFARDPITRQLWTAYLLSLETDRYYWDDQYKADITRACQQWVRILKEQDVKAFDEYQHFAWIAYKGGNIKLAKEWLELAPEKDGEAAWIAAKIALHEGNLTRAADRLNLAIASNAFPTYYPALYAELGRVYLAQDKPQAALTAWMLGGHWEDAAYLAERVLTTHELCRYIDQHLDGLEPPSEEEFSTQTLARNQQQLHDLAARRLMREEQFQQALFYFDADIQALAERYIALMQTAYDGARPAVERAADFWEAAQLIREHGMELFGTELYPDAKIWRGNIELIDEATSRQELATYESGPLAPTREELERLMQTLPPDQRFHYRYLAASLGGWAASLLPNDSEQTADILYTAGSWLKARDPQAAQPFYQALVIRCPNTPLGRAAAEKNWFPESTLLAGKTLDAE